MRFVILLSLIASCANIPDVPICVEETQSQAYCTYTISDKNFYINDLNKFDGETYWDMRVKMIRIPYKSWVEIKSYIIKQCKKTNCDKDVASWDSKLKTLDEKIIDKD